MTLSVLSACVCVCDPSDDMVEPEEKEDTDSSEFTCVRVEGFLRPFRLEQARELLSVHGICLLYTSDAADE